MKIFEIILFFSILSLFHCFPTILNPNTCYLSDDEIKSFVDCFKVELFPNPRKAIIELLDCAEENHRRTGEEFLVQKVLCGKHPSSVREVQNCLGRAERLEDIENTLSAYQLHIYDTSTACYRALRGKK